MGSVRLVSSLPSAPPAAECSCLEAFEREFEYLCRTLRRLGVRARDVEDEVHEVFLVLDRNWSEYDRSRPLRPYLFGIAFRVVAAGKRRQRRELPSTLDELAARALPHEALEAAHAGELVLRALDHIPLARRAVFVMHAIDEIPMRDITEAMSLPLFTGYSRLRKARQEFDAAVKALQQKSPGAITRPGLLPLSPEAQRLLAKERRLAPQPVELYLRALARARMTLRDASARSASRRWQARLILAAALALIVAGMSRGLARAPASRPSPQGEAAGSQPPQRPSGAAHPRHRP